MIIDLGIIIFLVSALLRGREIGFVRQLFSTIGFFGGLFLGAAIEPTIVKHFQSDVSRSVVALVTTLGSALLLLSLGEYLGILLKNKFLITKLNAVDNILGSVLSICSLLLSIWLGAALLRSLPLPAVSNALKQSRIIAWTDELLPKAPSIVADLGKLIDPNGFPEVFINGEPNVNKTINLPALGSLAAAVNEDKNSVVKIEGQGCGGIVEGSGFVVAPGLVATNAHVVDGIARPYVMDLNGTHTATPIWFDPNLDFAVLKVYDLAGSSLVVDTTKAADETPGVVLGYPGGGPFNAAPAAILDAFQATGKNIYGNGTTNRQVYEVQADIIPGNSGGPIVNEAGNVMGVVFAQSTTYSDVGYALTSAQIATELHQAERTKTATSTGSCAD